MKCTLCHSDDVGRARHRVRYDELEAAILDNCEHLRPHQVLPNPDEQDAACHAIRQRLAGREAELEHMEQRAANLLDQIERTTDAGIRDRYETRLRQLGEQKADLERQRADDETELRRRGCRRLQGEWNAVLERPASRCVHGESSG